MRIVIVGGSKFGVATAEQLIDKGHEVVLIDKNREKLEALTDRLDCGMIQGDGSSPKVLREAYAEENDVLVALTNASDDNILTALVARSVGFGRVIPQIVEAELLDVCVELDLKDTITPHVTVARSICRALEEDTELARDTNLTGDLRLLRLSVTSQLSGCSLSELDLPDECRAVAIVHEDREKFADPDAVVSEGEDILFAVHEDRVADLKALFATS
ncbi:potassium transporter [Roseobacter denitrificans]|uniref:Trk system potassium uptake protein TrkA n=1 Tax=Roseobacter denitrificans (strain ATCC 33942 / OCh 114) TaxID=375451 RepID=Q166R3_ROSDO|nr:NAD-binding protein [Roseobacter denitrificans]ABG32030.1 Trk potassium uptake system protein [Roseobacter denitrificans OCh 114]AVL51557.1 potassium transporter [Roseobacter denitrificans]SFG36558.1 trk system potassium uptake protein TrkA [Roseobacter denitrificans OCh 114]